MLGIFMTTMMQGASLPSVSTTGTNEGAPASNKKTVTIPSHVSGQYILVIMQMAVGSTPGAVVNTTDSVGTWDRTAGATIVNQRYSYIFGCLADGNNMSLTVDFTTSPTYTRSVVYVIDNVDAYSRAASSSSTNNPMDAPSHTIAATRNTLWIAYGITLNSYTPSAAPTNYTNLIGLTGASNGAIRSAHRIIADDLTEDPGAFTGTVTGQWSATTIGVYKA